MYIPVKTIENQYGEQVEEKTLTISPEEGKIYLTQLECYSAISLGLGTCRCVNHDPYSTEEISPDYAVELLKDAYRDGVIDDKQLEQALEAVRKVEEKLKQNKEYYKQNPIKYLVDYFGFKDEDELRTALEYAYDLGINPLPKLREALKKGGLGEWNVEWVYDPEDQVCIYGYKNTILIRERAGDGERSDLFIESTPYTPPQKNKKPKL